MVRYKPVGFVELHIFIVFLELLQLAELGEIIWCKYSLLSNYYHLYLVLEHNFETGLLVFTFLMLAMPSVLGASPHLQGGWDGQEKI